MDKKHHDYLLLFAAAILVIAVFAGVFLHQASATTVGIPGISGSFALGNCDELNTLFVQNHCDGSGQYDGYTCMKISEALHQLGCSRNQL